MSSPSGLPYLGLFKSPFDGRQIVYWEDPNSLKWLARGLGGKGFTKISRFYEAQSDKFMCGPGD
ncbi:MAG: hypothetical protein AB7N80_11505 [Bdellovibrionales bacterium]